MGDRINPAWWPDAVGQPAFVSAHQPGKQLGPGFAGPVVQRFWVIQQLRLQVFGTLNMNLPEVEINAMNTSKPVYGPTISTDWMTTGFTGVEPSPPGCVGALAIVSTVSIPATT